MDYPPQPHRGDHAAPLDPGPRHDPDLPPEVCPLAERAEGLAVSFGRTAAECEVIRSEFRGRWQWTAAWAYELGREEERRTVDPDGPVSR